MNVRVMVVDDHGILRAGLVALLSAEPGFEVVGEAADGQEAIRLARLLRPDVVLMDISMPGESGIETARRLTRLEPGMRILILTVHEDRSLIQEAISAGAAGFILKRALKAELISAIRTVLQGDLYVQPALMRAVLQRDLHKSAPKEGLLCELTQREIEVLRLVAKGYTNSQIADLLQISVRTVEFHRSNITGKLQIQSRVELVRFALDHGIMDMRT
jgi:two-component system response regulator NreC